MDETAFSHWVQAQFPTLDSVLYLNHAAISPWPRAAADAAAAFAQENCEHGPLRGGQWLLRENELRRACARLLNADSGDDIALLKNTSEGICVVANGLDWRAGDNIVTPQAEFVTNQLPWDALAASGVEVRRVAIRATEDPEAALIDALDARTRVLTVSAVAWDDGFRLDLERLGAACHESHALFFVDAIQQLGALELDVRACHVDALSAGAHKWLMGPEGMGVFYCSPAWRERLKLAQHGWRMLDEPYRFDRPDRSPSPTARRFEAGSPNTLGQAVMLASVKLLQELGIAEAQQRVLHNTDYLVAAISQMHGLRLASDTRPERRSGIVSIELDGGGVTELRRALARERIYVAERDGKLRISPHWYQGPVELERLLALLRSRTNN
ncbi:MAG: aminotransferase class V-fold PLP-dependent enzyme [Xanthomonadales bacterium]|nr:aminotransferase class V-fold PLP-dependent enzyme [Xanthomonadales bacterium]